MSRALRSAIGVALVASTALVTADQGPLDPALLRKPPAEAWPSYHGDYTGRHYSPLKQIDTTNAKALTMAWFYRTGAAAEKGMVGGGAPAAPAPAGPPVTGAAPLIKAIPLMV